MRGKRAIINQMEDLPLMRRRRRGAGRRMRGMRRLTYAGKCSQPKAFSLRRRWAALAARMRCSRRSGVIYIVLITAISWPTPHQSAFADSFSSRRSLLVSALTNYRYPPRQISPSNQPPRGTLIAAQRRAGEARPRVKAGSERRKACFYPGGSGFHLPRGRVARATPSLKPAAFPSTTQVLCYFLH